MKKFKFVYYLCAIAMIISLGNVFLNGNFPVEGGELLKNNWGIMTMVDLFAGIFVFSTWIVFREDNIFVILILMVAMMFLGFLTGSLYILYNLHTSKGDMSKFFLGKKRDKVLEEIQARGR